LLVEDGCEKMNMKSDKKIRLAGKDSVERLEIRIGPRKDVVFGSESSSPVVIAGPCAVESEEQILRIAEAVKNAGALALRGGAFKPRTSPYDFQGHGEEALKWLAKAREITGLPIVTEAIDEKSLGLVAEYADVIQIGARNSQNFALLKAAGKTQMPVLLKRGMAQRIDEWIMAAEYIMVEGNMNVILCERGIRTFGNHTRATLDIGAIAVAKSMSCLPIIADPSHAAGDVRFVPSLAKAALAGGADGLIIEVHSNPAKALSDAKQQLALKQFSELMDEMRVLKLV